MATVEGLIAAIDQVVAYFNARRMDLPDGLFDRKTQFVINGAPFETLLGQSPADPLVLMLSRGPAGFRFTAKALQHAIPDAKLERTQSEEPAPLEIARKPDTLSLIVRLTGTLRGTSEAINTAIAVTLRLNAAGQVEIASANVDPQTLDKIRQARLRA